MTSPIIKSLFASFLLLLSPTNGQVVSGTVKVAAVLQPSVTVAWTWAPDTNAMGGLSTNDYATNLWFQIYTSTNATLPLTNWTLAIDQFAASPWRTQYVAQIFGVSDGPSFYVGRTCSVRDQSPFSNVAPYVHAGGQFVLSIGQ